MEGFYTDILLLDNLQWRLELQAEDLYHIKTFLWITASSETGYLNYSWFYSFPPDDKGKGKIQPRTGHECTERE